MAIDALSGRVFDPASGKAAGRGGDHPSWLQAPAATTSSASALEFAGHPRTRSSTRPTRRSVGKAAPRGGYQVFGLAGYDPVALQNDPAARAARFKALAAGADAAAGLLNKFIDQVTAEHKLDARRVALLGFSQGTMMALHVGLRRTAPLAAILGYSGALTGADRLPAEIASKPPVCLVHGADDPVVPPHCLEDIAAALTPLGVAVETHMIPGLQHGIDNEGVRHRRGLPQKAIWLKSHASPHPALPAPVRCGPL